MSSRIAAAWTWLKVRKPQEIVTAAAILLIVIDTFIRPLSLTALGLVILALLPWLLPFISSMELPGGVKVEIRKLEEIRQEAEEAGLLASPETVDAQPAYRKLFDVDPTLALAGLRIELERRIGRLEEVSGVYSRSIRSSIGILSRVTALENAGVLSREQRSAIADLLPLLNAAAHARDFDPASAAWTMEVGPRLLAGLDEIIQRTAPGDPT
jgi:hypothetical protein